MTKRSLLSILLLAGSALSLLAQGPTITLNPANQGQVHPGSAVDIFVNLSGTTATPVAALRFTVKGAPDATTVTATAGMVATATSKQIACSPGTSTGGMICLIYGMNTTNLYDGQVAVLHVPVPASSSGTFTLTTDTTVAADGSGSEVALVAGPPLATQGVNPCDIDGNGAVNVADVQSAINQVIKQFQGIVGACSSADLIGTGTCSVVDVERVVAASLGGTRKTGK